MVLERLEFEGPDARYHSYLFAQHLVRYATVKDLVGGKRVLDVACGAGYGARLLSDWGAAEVVGVDKSAEAIATAVRLFDGPGRRFLEGDAECLATLLETEAPFDVIVSFETVEHLVHPERLLEALGRLRAPNGSVAISCPNDKIYYADNEGNPFHLHRFAFEEFRALAERHLGLATQWLLGAPVQGEIAFVLGDERVESGRADAEAIIAARSLSRALLLPSQKGIEVDAASCSFYLGFWGIEPGASVAVSAQSVTSYREPWISLDWLKGRTTELEREVAGHFKPEIARLSLALGECDRTRKALRLELQDHRARVLYYADQSTELTSQIELLRARCEVLEGLRHEGPDPEISRLAAVIVEYETTKREWFEPQLQQHQARLAEVEARLASMAQFERSLGYRVWRRLPALKDVPVIGPLLRGCRSAIDAIARR